MSTITAREFNQDVASAKRAANDGPVFITDRGNPAHVLMTIDQYRRITRAGPSIVEMLADPESADIEFDPPRMNFVSRPVDLSD